MGLATLRSKTKFQRRLDYIDEILNLVSETSKFALDKGGIGAIGRGVVYIQTLGLICGKSQLY